MEDFACFFDLTLTGKKYGIPWSMNKMVPPAFLCGVRCLGQLGAIAVRRPWPTDLTC